MTEAQIAERLGMSFAEYQAVIRKLEQAGFPRPDPTFHRRRYWPAVKAYLDRRAGLKVAADTALGPDGEEHWND